MGMSVHLLPPPPGYWHTYIFLLSGRSRSPTRNRTFSVFAKSTRPCKYVFIPILSLNPQYTSKCFSDFTLCLSASLSFLSCSLLLTVCLVPPQVLYGHPLFSVSPISLRTFSTTFSHLIPARPFITISKHSSINYGWQPLLGHLPSFILPFKLSRVSISCLEWVHSQFCS